MKYKIVFLLAFTLLFSCEKKAEIGIGTIQIPKYYSKYDFWKFHDSIAKLKGFEIHGHSKNTDLKRFDLKDSVSKNFLTITEMHNGLLLFERNPRIQYLKEEEGLKIKVINESYEIYHGNSEAKNDLTNESLHWFKAYFLIKKDSACFQVYYCTYDNDSKKIKDYHNIITRVEEECINGTVFKTSAEKHQKPYAIAN